MSITHRTGLISAYFSKTRNFPISLQALVKNGMLQKTCEQVGPRYVVSITDGGDLEEVHIRDLSSPLYWPKDIPHHELYKSCTDCLYPAHWHHYEVPETSVESGESVVDCGAAEGLFALSVSHRAGKMAIFEPWSAFYASLQATFGKRAEIYPQALGDRTHTAYLFGEALYGVVSETEGVEIPVTTLDEHRAAFGPVNYIKADVEGSEHSLIAGAKETIFKDKPKIAITVYHLANDWERMVKFIRDIVPEYKFKTKGISNNGGKARPVMLHMWT